MKTVTLVNEKYEVLEHSTHIAIKWRKWNSDVILISRLWLHYSITLRSSVTIPTMTSQNSFKIWMSFRQPLAHENLKLFTDTAWFTFTSCLCTWMNKKHFWNKMLSLPRIPSFQSNSNFPAKQKALQNLCAFNNKCQKCT